MMFLITTLICLLAFYVQKKRKNPEKIFKVYSQPGKWYYLKYFLFLALLTLRKIKSKLHKSSSGLGVQMDKYENLERLQPLSSHEKAFDAVFFQGGNREGFYYCSGLERRHKCKANGIAYFVVPELGLLENEELPNTELDVEPVSIHYSKEYSAGGIKFRPVEPMKEWKIAYSGKMRLKGSNEVYDVKFEADWTSNRPPFLYDQDLNLKTIARSIAREKWSRELFENLKTAHQSHYEQMGKVKGVLQVNEKSYHVEMDSFRDHSFGHKRDWLLLYRYAFHMIYLENGLKAVVGVICQPTTSSHFEVGFVSLPNGEIHSLQSCDLLLYQHGEKGQPGNNIGFTFIANDIEYAVSATTKYESVHFKGNNVEARLIERFLEYDVNGIKGVGNSEWHYNNIYDASNF